MKLLMPMRQMMKYTDELQHLWLNTFSKEEKLLALHSTTFAFCIGLTTCSGQTGSGKTFTMLDSTNGLYVKAGRDIFNLLRQPQNAHLSAWVSFYEIYQGHLYDLLGNRKKLYAREDGKQQVVIKGIQEYEVDRVDRLMQIFEAGNATRSTGNRLLYILLPVT